MVLKPKQFFGGAYGGWIKLLPISWIPYLQLTRLNVAAPLALVYFPHLLGVLHEVATNENHNYSPSDALILAPSFSGAAYFIPT